MEINSKQAIKILREAGSCGDITVLNAIDKNSVMTIEGRKAKELCLTVIEQDLKTLDIMKQYVRIENGCLTLVGVSGMLKISITDDNDLKSLKDKFKNKAPNCIVAWNQSSEMRGDCTSSYDIELKPNTTLKELIEYVLTNLNEWGYFHCERYSVEYDKSGDIKGENSLLPFYDRKIKKVVGSGGYSCMDYFITLEE